MPAQLSLPSLQRVNIPFKCQRLSCRDIKILVIEDDADIASNIGQYFEDKGHQLDFDAHCYQLSDGRFDITSGNLRRAWQFGPGTRPLRQDDLDALLALIVIGWPNSNSPLSVTVAGPTCTEADILSTLKDKTAETLLNQQSFKYWCYR